MARIYAASEFLREDVVLLRYSRLWLCLIIILSLYGTDLWGFFKNIFHQTQRQLESWCKLGQCRSYGVTSSKIFPYPVLALSYLIVILRLPRQRLIQINSVARTTFHFQWEKLVIVFFSGWNWEATPKKSAIPLPISLKDAHKFRKASLVSNLTDRRRWLGFKRDLHYKCRFLCPPVGHFGTQSVNSFKRLNGWNRTKIYRLNHNMLQKVHFFLSG